MSICRKCDEELTDENWNISARKKNDYICKLCSSAISRERYASDPEKYRQKKKEYRESHLEEDRERSKQWRLKNKERAQYLTKRWKLAHPERVKELSKKHYYKTHSGNLMSDNPKCSYYLGICVAENVLKSVFKNVEQMPPNYPGYDFICNNGYRVNVKCSCLTYKKWKAPRWNFYINMNKDTDYFLFLAFDNREDLNPMHIWLIPGDIVNCFSGVGATINTIGKWDEYKLDIDKVIKCCDAMKGDNNEINQD